LRFSDILTFVCPRVAVLRETQRPCESLFQQKVCAAFNHFSSEKARSKINEQYSTGRIGSEDFLYITNIGLHIKILTLTWRRISEELLRDDAALAFHRGEGHSISAG
jgi:hypothetical protein